MWIFVKNWGLENVDFVKNEWFRKCEFCLFLHFQWNPRGSFAQNYVFPLIFSEIPDVLLLKILFFSSFPVKSQRFFCSKFKFSKKSRQKSHKIWPKSMSWQWQFWHSVMTRCPQKNPEIQCSACKASFEKAQNLVNGDNMCVSHNNLRL